MKCRVLYISGHVAEHPNQLRSLPPLDSGAPHSNMYRLVECFAKEYQDNYKIDVISPLAQTTNASELFDANKEHNANYHFIRIPDWWRQFSASFGRITRYGNAVIRRLWGAPGLQGLYYIQQVKKLYRTIKADLVIHDEGPQYIRGFSRFIPREKLLFYCRGDMGRSREDLHLPSGVIATNSNLGAWVRSVNSRVAHIYIVHNSLAALYESIPLNPERLRRAEKRIVFVGRVVPVKGVRQLLEAFSIVVKSYEAPVKLEIIGSGSPQTDESTPNTQPLTSFEREMRLLAETLMPPEFVTWKGWLSQEELVSIYCDADLAVYPSTWIEGFGMVALEAMACGVPVIASQRPGFESLLSQGRGILVDPDNIPALAEAMLSVLTDVRLAQQLAQKGHEHAQHYTLKSAAEELANVIEKHRG